MSIVKNIITVSVDSENPFPVEFEVKEEIHDLYEHEKKELISTMRQLLEGLENELGE